MGIKVAVLSFCPKALISSAFWFLRYLLLLGRMIAHRQSSPQRHRIAVGYRLFYGKLSEMLKKIIMQRIFTNKSDCVVISAF